MREASDARATPEPSQAPDLAGDSAVVGFGPGEGVEATGVGLGEGATDATGVAGGVGVGADGPLTVKMPTPAATMQASATSPVIRPTFRDPPTRPAPTGGEGAAVGPAAASV